jgi:integrase
LDRARMPKLTKRIVDAAEIRATEYFIWDDDIPGFGLRVLPSKRKSYIVQYRAGRRSRRMSLGLSTVLTCEQARTRAIAIVAAAKNGEDPAAKRDADRQAITVKELAERFDKEHISVRVKESTAKGYRRMLERVIIPALGRHRVTEVTRADIAKIHHDLRHIPYDANRCLEIISKMFSLAEMWGLRPEGTNPRKHIKKYPEEKRERFLSAAELRRVGEVLREMEVEGIELPSAIAAVRLLILTGSRLGEIMTLKWEHVDIPSKALRLPDSKTGAKVVHLGQPAIEVLERIERVEKNPWVIVGTKYGARLSDLQPFWQRVRARAGLKDVRIHDLRHTFASTAVAAGQGLPMIGKLLGHTQVQTTARYAHLAADPVKAAAEKVASNLALAIGG